MPPLWATLIIDALFIFVLPWIIGAMIDIVRLRAQRFPDHRITATEKLALQAAKSIGPIVGVAARQDAADVALLELLKEYRVAVPSKKARQHCLNAAFFDISG